MDGLSGASSVFAVVSIAVQLGQGIKQLVDFWKTVQDAPARVNSLFRNLELLGSILDQTKSVTHTRVKCTLEAVLSDCRRKVVNLERKITFAKVGQGEKRLRRKWNDLKVTLKTDEIKELQGSIEEAKTSLQLVLLNSIIGLVTSSIYDQKQASAELGRISFLMQNMGASSVASRSEDTSTPSCSLPPESNEDSLVLSDNTSSCSELDQTQESDEADSSSAQHLTKSERDQTRSLRKFWALDVHLVLLRLRAHTITYAVTSSYKGEVKTSVEGRAEYLLYPTSAGKLLGICHGMLIQASSRTDTNWQYSLQPFRAVPDDALVFEFCRNGNLAGIRTLLERGEASPFDRDTSGRTPLWVAVSYCKLEIAKLLLLEGADPLAKDWCRKRNAMGVIRLALDNKDLYDVDPYINMIRLLQRYAKDDFGGFTYGHAIHDHLLRLERTNRTHDAQREHAIIQVSTSLLSAVDDDDPFLDTTLCVALFYMAGPTLVRLILKKLLPIRFLSASAYAAFLPHRAMQFRLLHRDPEAMKIIIRQTTDLHSPASFFATFETTITMAAMFDELGFLQWRKLVKELGYNIEDFVSQELQAGAISRQGWNHDSLVFLFNEDIKPESPAVDDVGRPFSNCDRCGHRSVKLRVHLRWRRRLRQIRRKFSQIKDGGINTLPNDGMPSVCSSLPYNVVCPDHCLDGICVAWLYDNDGIDKPEFPPYPLKVESDEDEKECITANMPGHFQE